MPSTTERLHLAGPAASAWRALAPVLARHLGEPTQDLPPWLLAGGTLLAARWGWHRESTDIDIVVTSSTALALWPMADTEGRLPRLDNDLARRGWTLDPSRTTAWQRGYHNPETCGINHKLRNLAD